MNSQCCMQNMAPKRLRNSSFLSRIAWTHCKTPFNPSSSPHSHAPCSLSIGVSITAPTNHCLTIRAQARLGSLTFSPLPSHASTLSCYQLLPGTTLLMLPTSDARSLFLDDYFMFTNRVSTGYCNPVTDPYVPDSWTMLPPKVNVNPSSAPSHIYTDGFIKSTPNRHNPSPDISAACPPPHTWFLLLSCYS